LVAWLMTPGISTFPGGSLTLCHTVIRARGEDWRPRNCSDDIHLQQQIDDALERDVEGMRPVPAAQQM